MASETTFHLDLPVLPRASAEVERSAFSRRVNVYGRRFDIRDNHRRHGIARTSPNPSLDRHDAFLASVEPNLIYRQLNSGYSERGVMYPDRSVVGYWSPKVADCFIVTAGRFDFKEGVQVGATPFMVVGWGGFGKDYVLLRIRGEEREGFLVVKVSAFWHPPLRFRLLRCVLSIFTPSSYTVKARFGDRPPPPTASNAESSIPLPQLPSPIAKSAASHFTSESSIFDE